MTHLKTIWRAAGVAAALVSLAACSSKPPGPTIDPALSTLVPADTTMLVGIRVEDLTKTPIYKKYLSEQRLPQIDEFAAEFGIDPRKDLWELLIISNGTESEVVGRGRFSNEAEPRVTREYQGAKRFNYRGFTLVGDDNSAVLMMGPSLMAVGTTSGLKKMIDTRDKTNGPPEALQERMREIPQGMVMWAVSSGTKIALPPNPPANAANLAKVAQSIQSGFMYLDLRNGVNAKAVGITADDAQAKELYNTIRGLQGLVQMMGSKDDKRVQRMVEGVRVTEEGPRVNVYVEENDDAVQTLADVFSRMGPGRGPGRGKGSRGDDIPTPLE